MASNEAAAGGSAAGDEKVVRVVSVSEPTPAAPAIDAEATNTTATATAIDALVGPTAHIALIGSDEPKTPRSDQPRGLGEEDADTENAVSSSSNPLGSPSLRNSKGWDGKLRLPKKTVLANPEALSEPEYSDDDNVVPGEVISADEDLLDEEDPDTDEINCTHSRVHSIDALRLERFPNCQRLCLRQNLIERIDGCAGLAALAGTLQELDLYDNLISHMRGVEVFGRRKGNPEGGDEKDDGQDVGGTLTSLDLSFNKIRHIKHLGGLVGLRDLYLVANKISTIDGLDKLTRLRQLELGSNRIREIRGLDHLAALEELWLAKNKITSLAGLQGMPRLRLLSVQANRISDLSPLRAVPSLEELYLSHNMLESIESLATPFDENGKGKEVDLPRTSILPNLRTLDISNNKVASLRGTEGLVQLEELWASYNLVADFADVERALADKKNLETVYLEGNPLQLRSPALYRNKVRLALPQIKQIDATYVH